MTCFIRITNPIGANSQIIGTDAIADFNRFGFYWFFKKGNS